MASSSTKLTMKLLVDAKSEKVLFAEASKTVVDFLFSLLSLPLSTVIRILNKKDMVGCLSNLYQSVENLDETYMQSNQHKYSLLKPRVPIFSAEICGLLPSNDDCSTNNLRFYKCQNHNDYVTCDSQTRCPHQYSVAHEDGLWMTNKEIHNCDCFMDCEVHYCDGNKVAEDIFSNKIGFVKEVITYIIEDDLIIHPMSTISSIMFLKKFNVNKVGDLQEKVVEFGMAQGFELLKASLQSKTVLTSVFLKSD